MIEYDQLRASTRIHRKPASEISIKLGCTLHYYSLILPNITTMRSHRTSSSVRSLVFYSVLLVALAFVAYPQSASASAHPKHKKPFINKVRSTNVTVARMFDSLELLGSCRPLREFYCYRKRSLRAALGACSRCHHRKPHVARPIGKPRYPRAVSSPGHFLPNPLCLLAFVLITYSTRSQRIRRS
jgi:cytochrome c553